jgi:HlyD family secretion protein
MGRIKKMSSNKQQEPQESDLLAELQAADSKSPFTLKRWFITIITVLVAGFSYLFFIQSGPPELTTLYKTVEAYRGKLTVIVTATGTLQPLNQVDVGTEVSGTVESVRADYNDTVKEGQVLAVLDTSALKTQVKQSEALLASARANLLQVQADVLEAEKELTRLRQVSTLSKGKLPAARELDVAEIALQRSQANEAKSMAAIDEAVARLSMDQTTFEKATILSPINGIVLERSVEVGQTVAASLQAPVLFTLAEDLSKMELQVSVDEADVGKLQKGQDASFMVDAYPKRTFPSTTRQVRYGAQTDEGVVTYLTILEVDNNDLSLRPGMTATADIVVKQIDDALLVPNAALRFTPKRMAPDTKPSGNGNLLSKIMPGPPRRSKQPTNKTLPRDTQSSVWVLENNRPVEILVVAGTSNDSMTEIVSGEISAESVLITETISGEH